MMHVKFLNPLDHVIYTLKLEKKFKLKTCKINVDRKKYRCRIINK